MKRPSTPNRGAADIVARFLRKLKRMKATKGSGCIGHAQAMGYIEAVDEMTAFSSDWDKRAAKKVGGLGRK